MPDLEAAVPEGFTRVVMLREPSLPGQHKTMVVHDSDRRIGQLAAGGFLAWECPAGRRVLRVALERSESLGGDLFRLIGQEGASGETLHYLVSAVEAPAPGQPMAIVGRPIVKRLSSVEGEEWLMKSDTPDLEDG